MYIQLQARGKIKKKTLFKILQNKKKRSICENYTLVYVPQVACTDNMHTKIY